MHGTAAPTTLSGVLAPDDPFERVEVTVADAQGVLADQHPDLAGLPVRVGGSGWDNATFRLGDDLAVRMPVRGIGDVLAANEQAWLPHLAPRLPLPTPVPVRTGHATDAYPWRWSVVPWIPGRPALHAPPEDPVESASVLGEFVRALRATAPPEAPPNPYRGQPLAERATLTVAHLDSLGDDHPDQAGLDAAELRACWEWHVAVPVWTGEPQWIHGDLHPLNLVVDRGAIAGVLDFGDVTSGDPATDLFAAWVLFDGAARQRFLDLTADDEAMRRRGRGWALAMAAAYLANREDHNVLRPLGRRTIEAVLADWRDHP